MRTDHPDSVTDMTTLLRRSRRALVIGVGGGGDIVGTVPTARLLELFGIASVLGGLSWERFVYDPLPGTRSLEEVRHARPLAPTVWLASGETETHDGVRFAESGMAAALGVDTLMLDLSRGTAGVASGLRAALEALEADLLIGIDVGGDSLARGDEPGLRSPLADAMMLAALTDPALGTPAIWGVIGRGTDGELTGEEFDRALSRVAEGGGLLGAWGVTPDIAEELAGLLEHVRTEASALVVRAARGGYGTAAIRDGTRRVELTPACAVTFYLSPAVLARVTPLADAVRDSRSLEEANAALLARGIPTEYEFEKEMQRRGLHRYPG